MKTTMTAAPLQALELPSSRPWLDALTAWFREASVRAMRDEAPAFPTTAEARQLGETARANALR